MSEDNQIEKEINKIHPLTSLEVKRLVKNNWTDDFKETGKEYHNLEHVDDVYDSVTELCNFINEKRSKAGKELLSERTIEEIQLAAIYHDIAWGLQDCKKETHEEQSAEIAQKELSNMGFFKVTVERVVNLIMGTKGEMVDGVYVYEETDDLAIKILRDSDMAIIGKPGYPKANERLRKEEKEEDIPKWIKGQLVFLGIKFQTDEAEELWGEERKENRRKLESGEIIFG